jgi:hypothetical protein
MTKCNASSSKNVFLDIKVTFVTRDGKINLLKDHSTVTQELLCQAIPGLLFGGPEKRRQDVPDRKKPAPFQQLRKNVPPKSSSKPTYLCTYPSRIPDLTTPSELRT